MLAFGGAALSGLSGPGDWFNETNRGLGIGNSVEQAAMNTANMGGSQGAGAINPFGKSNAFNAVTGATGPASPNSSLYDWYNINNPVGNGSSMSTLGEVNGLNLTGFEDIPFGTTFPEYIDPKYATGLSSIWQDLPSALTKIPGLASVLFGSGNTSGSYSFPFGKVLGGVLDAYGSSQQRDDLKSYLDKSLEYADPFHSQRPQYQTQFRNLTQNPSNFFNDPGIANAINFEDQATSRKLASQGYNMSGNFANDVAQTRMREAFKQYMPYTDMIGTAAGYKFGPGASGQIAANAGTAIAGTNQQIMGGLGSAFNDATSGAQPTYLEQIFGKGQNQNLLQYLMQQGVA